jgi:predicted CopG family antitoxin
MAQSEKRLPVSEDTFNELGEFKGAGETWNDVVKELIERSHELNRQELLERTDDDEYVPLEEA